MCYFLDGNFHSSFLVIIDIHDSSANGLTNAIKEFFIYKAIPLWENTVGFYAGTTNVMMGDSHSVATLLKSFGHCKVFLSHCQDILRISIAMFFFSSI